MTETSSQAPAPVPAAASTSAPRPVDPNERRRVYRRRRIVVFGTLALLIALLVGGGVYTANALGAPVPAAAPDIEQPAPVVAAPQSLALPGFGGYAVGAIGFDGLLAAGNADQPMASASITKVITSLVILEQHPVAAGENGPDIEYTDADVDIYWDMIAQNGSVAPVEAGATLSLRESLEALLLPSGNNYAISLSNWAFGSEQGLVDAARTWLDAHGFANTRIADASGLSLENTSTPADLVKLGELALAEPVLAEIVATQKVDIPELGSLENSNKLLGTHGVDGIKTGTTDDAANLLFSADYAVGDTTVTVVGVVLGGENHAMLREAIAKLLDSVAPGFHQVAPLEAGQELASYDTPWGDTARARAADGASVVVWSDTPVEVEVRAEPLTLANEGEEVGTAVVRAGAQEITVPLVLDAEIDDPGTWWRLANPAGLEPATAQSGSE
ncbi:D-alanyl-D-alanine carboxypeptidase family protein [Agromyces sp. NPDC058104]|uniref:D-alanyl-D-alanine carboxypeptidase family protein n=1 Tax=Agromyces sp. NPDC058104 TaxID=3346342 RepID=UPI0036D9C13A